LCLIACARSASIFARECQAYMLTAASRVAFVPRGSPNMS
jgi:hypothetical protein